jgi:hypothetical protein
LARGAIKQHDWEDNTAVGTFALFTNGEGTFNTPKAPGTVAHQQKGMEVLTAQLEVSKPAAKTVANK